MEHGKGQWNFSFKFLFEKCFEFHIDKISKNKLYNIVPSAKIKAT